MNGLLPPFHFGQDTQSEKGQAQEKDQDQGNLLN
jgi:hypothetical protein